MVRALDIFHLDDNPGDLALFEAALAEHTRPVSYHGERDPVAGMADLSRRALSVQTRPSLLVLDLNMPRVRGTDVLEFLRRNPDLSGIPVVMLTTSTQIHEAEQCRRLGARAVFIKPISYEVLVELMHEILSHAAPCDCCAPD